MFLFPPFLCSLIYVLHCICNFYNMFRYLFILEGNKDILSCIVLVYLILSCMSFVLSFVWRGRVVSWFCLVFCFILSCLSLSYLILFCLILFYLVLSFVWSFVWSGRVVSWFCLVFGLILSCLI
jgi:hypothetical protein